MHQALSLSILTLTIAVALRRPQIGSRRIEPADAAIVGAFCALLTGIVQPWQVMQAVRVLALPAITIASLMAITLIAERAGLLRLLAFWVARAAGGNARTLFAYLFLLGAVMGTVFTNDAAILIMTPLVFGLIEDVKGKEWTLENKIPFYFAVLYVGNLVGALIISNPINIVVTSVFGIGFLDYATWMLVPALVASAVSFVGLRVFFRRTLPSTYVVPLASRKPPIDEGMIIPCAVVLALTLLGFFTGGFTGLPVWIVALAGAVGLAAVHSRRGYPLGEVVRGIGWDVIIFVAGIFIIVIGLRNQGAAKFVGDLILTIGGSELAGLTAAAGFVAAVCSAFFNNHPTAGLMIWVLEDFSRPFIETKLLVFAVLIGGDLGPKMLPIGSLAALMWFRMLRARGVDVSYWLYICLGVPVTLLAVALSLLALELEWLAYKTFVD